MKKMLLVVLMLIVALVAAPSFASSHDNDNSNGCSTGCTTVLDSASFAGVMGIAQGSGGTGSTIASASNIAQAGPVTHNDTTQANTAASSSGASSYTVNGNGQAMAIQFGAALAVYSNNGGHVTGTFNPLTAGSVATFGVTW